MSKQAEIDYLKNIGVHGVKHAINKPFSDKHCGSMLSEIAAVISLLPQPPAKILDMGCGTGWSSIFLAKRGYSVVGTDISQDMILCAIQNQKKEELNKLSFVVGDYEDGIFGQDFDAVLFFDSLHHAENEQNAVSNSYKSLKRGGLLLVSEPGEGHEERQTSILAVNKYGVIEKNMSPRYIIKLGKLAGFSKFKIYPRANLINRIIYEDKGDLPLKKFQKFLLKYSLFRFISVLILVSFYKRRDGIVVMMKD